MVIGFVVLHESAKYTFAAKNIGSYKEPKYKYTCNGRECTKDCYDHALDVFKTKRAK